MSIDKILKELEKCEYKVSTDTRKDISGSIYFALKGETHDGNHFVKDALEKGAVVAVTDKKENAGENVYVVEDSLKTLQEVARKYREQFNIPIIAIGGSNGKTTSKDLVRDVLKTKYKVFATAGNLNNEIGVPLSILSIKKDCEIAIIEVGANRRGDHKFLLDMVRPTHVAVTNNGMDHLEGFGSPEGVRMANKEIYDWALQHSATAFVNKKHPDLVLDSEGVSRVLYPEKELEYKTKLAGDYNRENIELALAVGNSMDVKTEDALRAIASYEPSGNRSQVITKNGINFVVDCYNANPSSMKASLESFLKDSKNHKGVVLGDMLELGKYSLEEHKKVVKYLSEQKLDFLVFVGEEFKKALVGESLKHLWFPDSEKAKDWFRGEKFDGFTFLLKGSRGMKIEKILE
ncbi:MAG: Mur ligase family protein [Patescibacteria group bacterium]